MHSMQLLYLYYSGVPNIWAKLYCYFRKGNTIFFCLISLEQTIRSPSCPTTKYMTLVLKFFCCNKMTITRRRSNLFPKFRKIPAALDEYFAMAVSNRDLKPFWDFLWKFACDLGFASYLKFKISKVWIEVKLLKLYFVVRPWLHQQRIKRLNQRMKRTNTRFKHQSD